MQISREIGVVPVLDIIRLELATKDLKASLSQLLNSMHILVPSPMARCLDHGLEVCSLAGEDPRPLCSWWNLTVMPRPKHNVKLISSPWYIASQLLQEVKRDVYTNQIIHHRTYDHITCQ